MSATECVPAALTIFPVWVDAPALRGLEWDPGALRVSERSGLPVVSELIAHNSGNRELVALEGDLLVGGFQDRMLVGSTVLAPHESRVVDALCVEQRRWSGGQAHESGGRKSAASVRYGNVAAGEQGHPQSEVWRRIERFENAFGHSASSSMTHHLDAAEPVVIGPIDGQRGVVIGIGGHVIGGEIFGSSPDLRARWKGIIAAAAVDARLAPTVPTSAEDARRFARRLAAARFDDVGDAGRAVQVHFTRGNLRATGIRRRGDQLFDDGGPVIHLAAFDAAHPLLENA